MSQVVKMLMQYSQQTIVLDNFSTGIPKNLDHLENNPRLTMHHRKRAAHSCEA